MHASGRQSASPEVHPESSVVVPPAAVAAGTAETVVVAAAVAAYKAAEHIVDAAAAADLSLCRNHPAGAARGPARVLYLRIELLDLAL